MNKHETNPVSAIAGFENLSRDAQRKLTQVSDRPTYAPREQIIDYLEHDDSVYFLLRGRAKVVIYSESGRIVAFREITQGDIVGELAAIDGGPRTASVETITTCEFLKLSAEQFRILLTTEAAFAYGLCQHLTGQVRKLTSRIYEFSTFSVPFRVHAELLRLAVAGEVTGNTAHIVNAPTHAEIASRISTHREAVSREMSKLARSGIITRSGTDLIVCDLEKLSTLVSDARNE